MIYRFEGATPRIAPSAFVAASADVIGDVYVGARSSVWFGAVLRADQNAVRVGEGTNVQDGTIVHSNAPDIGGRAVVIGDGVTIGHCVHLHDCTIGDACLIGSGSIVLDGATVEPHSFVAAGSLIAPGMTIPAGKMAVGSPARVLRDTTADELEQMQQAARSYVALTRRYIGGLDGITGGTRP